MNFCKCCLIIGETIKKRFFCIFIDGFYLRIYEFYLRIYGFYRFYEFIRLLLIRKSVVV